VQNAIENREILPEETWEIGSLNEKIVCIPAGCETIGYRKIASFSISTLRTGLSSRQWGALLIKCIISFERRI